MYANFRITVLLGIAALMLTATVALQARRAAPADHGEAHGPQAANQAQPKAPARPAVSTPAPARPSGGPVRTRVNTPPLPNVGFAPVRPMDVVRATYDFAAQHPEVLKYVPCYCGCGSQGHTANESCFVARRDPRGNVLEWDTHGFGCAVCVDVARESMQMYTSGADVYSIRAAIERKWTPTNAAGKTPTPMPARK